MTTPQFDVFQQVFSLSQLSNVLFSDTGTQTQLQAQAEQDLKFYFTFQGQSNTPDPSVPPVIGDWTIVWGPVVWKAEPNNAKTGPSNTIFVAHSPSVTFPGASGPVDTYVVAIAGTAVHSVFDILTEDAGVSSVVRLDAWLDGKGWSTTAAPPKPSAQALAFAEHPFIDNGTATGVWALLANAPPSKTSAVGAGTYLAGFLSGLPSTSTVVFAGHSLGGALSPTLAAALQMKGWLPSYKSNANADPATGVVYIYPTAGASPGNPNFANAYNAAFPIPKISQTGTYKVWNAVTYNTIDVVPHAWAVQKYAIDGRFLQAIPGIYGNQSGSKAYNGAQGLVDLAVAKQAVTNCHYTPLQGNAFAGPFQDPVPSLKGGPVAVGTPPTDLNAFETEALFQHIPAYDTFVGITDLPKRPGPLQAVAETAEAAEPA